LTSQYIYFFSEFGSNLMYHNLMRLWHIFQNYRSHTIVTYHVEIKFFKIYIYIYIYIYILMFSIPRNAIEILTL